MAVVGAAAAGGDAARDVGPKEAQALIRENAGNRSAGALGIMGELGFRSDYHLEGGIQRWLEEGLPAVQ